MTEKLWECPECQAAMEYKDTECPACGAEVEPVPCDIEPEFDAEAFERLPLSVQKDLLGGPYGGDGEDD